MLKCSHCSSVNFVKNGTNRGKNRFLCKDCNKTFTDNKRKYTLDDKISAIEDYLDGGGIRKVARRLKTSASLILYWIKKCGKVLSESVEEAKKDLPTKPEEIEIVEIDEMVSFVKKNPKKSGYGMLWIGTKVVFLRLK